MMRRRKIAVVVLIVIAAAERVDDLSALVVAQARQIENMQQQLQSLAAGVKALGPAEQQGREPGREPDYFDSDPGRRLQAPASQRTTWHHGVFHSFDNPSTCGLHAELDSDATGPMDFTRSSDGNVTVGYGGATSATQPAAFGMNHPANCRTATLTSNHPLTVTGSLTTTGNLVVGDVLKMLSPIYPADVLWSAPSPPSRVLVDLGSQLALLMMFNSGRRLLIRHAKTDRYLQCNDGGVTMTADNNVKLGTSDNGNGGWEKFKIGTERGGAACRKCLFKVWCHSSLHVF